MTGMAEQSKEEASMRLRHRLSDAHRAYTDAMSRFDEIAKRPGELPHPDGALRIRRAGREVDVAYLQYIAAVQQCRDFALDGVVPDDLFPPK
jgi:hypothetical protein